MANDIEAILKLRDEFSETLKQAQTQLAGFGTTIQKNKKSLADLGKSIQSFGTGMRNVGMGLTAAVTLPIVAVGAAAIKAGMNAVESENLFEVSFGKMAASARVWSEDLKDSLGLSAFELRRTSGTFFVMFESMGLASDEAFNMSRGLVQLAHDMASFYNIDAEEAFEKIRAGITGEMEPLKRLGILLDEATIKEAAYTAGLVERGAKLTMQEKVSARYISLMQQTTKAQGDLARTMDSPLNQLRIMQETVSDLAKEFGVALLPAFQKILDIGKVLVSWLQDGVEWFSSLTTTTQNTILAVAGVVVAIGPLLTVAGLMVAAIGSLIAGFGGLVVGMKVAVIAGAALYGSWKIMEMHGIKLTDVILVLVKGVRIGVEIFNGFRIAVRLLQIGVINLVKPVVELARWMDKLRGKTTENADIMLTWLDDLKREAEIAMGETIDQNTEWTNTIIALEAQVKKLGESESGLKDEIIKQIEAARKAVTGLEVMGTAVKNTATGVDTLAFSLKDLQTIESGIAKSSLRELFKAGMAGAPDAPLLENLATGKYETLVYQVGQVKTETQEVISETVAWDDAVSALADQFRMLGIDASSTIGAIVMGVSQLLTAMPALADSTKSILGGEGKMGSKLLAAAQAGISGAAAMWQATGTGTQRARIGKGALQGAATGAQIGGPIGAGVGAAIGAIMGALRGRGTRKLVKEIGQEYGVDITEEMAKEIEKLGKALDVGKVEASLLSLGEILRAGGGLSADNVTKITTQFRNLLNAVANDSVPAAEGLNAISDAFIEISGGLRTMGVEGAVHMAGLIDRMKELGLVTEEVQRVIEATAASAVANLSVFFDYLAGQLGDQGALGEGLASIELASANVGILAGAFAAAVTAAGGLGGAIAMLPESFDTLMEKFKELLGTENAMFVELSRYYEFAKNNSEQLAALEALAAGFQDLLAIGIVNRSNIDSFAEAFRAQFNSMIEKVKDKQLALATIGPQIAVLLQSYKELGIKVPDWLAEIAAEAEAAGASLEPPEGIEDILSGIRDVLWEIAEALGAATRESDKLNTSLGSAPPGPSGGRRSPNAPPREQHGFDTTVSSPTNFGFQAGEAGPERVSVTPLDGGGGGGGAPLSVELMIDGEVLGRWIGNATKEGTARVHLSSIGEF